MKKNNQDLAIPDIQKHKLSWNKPVLVTDLIEEGTEQAKALPFLAEDIIVNLNHTPVGPAHLGPNLS
jgi:hypothetical protein